MVFSFSEIKFRGGAVKKLIFGAKNNSGRNNRGRITVRHRGGGCKKKNRLIDFKKYIWNVFGMVHRIEYDPKRNCLIALVVYSNGVMSYNLATQDLSVGNFIMNGSKNLSSGNATPIYNIPIGWKINSVELIPNMGAQLIRSAGTYAVLVSKFEKLSVIKLKSGEVRKINSNSMATMGAVSNFRYMYHSFKKAGYYRLRGWRPEVRGVAMNPVDHPHGGGQGKTSGGRSSVTPWGFITKGKPTVLKRRSFIIKPRRSL